MRHRPRHSLSLRTSAAALAVPLALALASCGTGDDAAPGAEESAAVDAPAGDEADAGDADRDDAQDEDPDTDDEAAADGSSKDAAAGGKGVVGQADAGDTLTPAEFTAILDAAFDRATTAKVAMENDNPQLDTSSTGVIDFTGDSPRLQMSLTGGPLPEGTTADIRLVEDGMYMDTGFSGGKFIKVPADQIAATGIDLSDIDPSRAARSFAEAASKVTYVGTESVRGESLHRYTLELDPSRLDLPGRAQGQAPKRVDYDAWFDRDGLLRKVTTAMGKYGTTTVTYDDWGAPVSISAPPASDVMEMPTLPKSPQG